MRQHAAAVAQLAEHPHQSKGVMWTIQVRILVLPKINFMIAKFISAFMKACLAAIVLSVFASYVIGMSNLFNPVIVVTLLFIIAIIFFFILFIKNWI